MQDADLSMFARHTPTSIWADASTFSPALLDAVREQGLLDETFALTPRLATLYRGAALGAGTGRPAPPDRLASRSLRRRGADRPAAARLGLAE